MPAENSNNNIRKTLISRFPGIMTYVLLALLVFFPEALSAQCAMCRAVLESSGDNSMAEGINDGIVYLMAIPYILVAFLFYFVYRKMRS